MKPIGYLALAMLTGCIVPPQSGDPYQGGYGGGGGGYNGDPSTSAGNATGGASPSSNGPISVTIRSACPRTVSVFYGSDPKCGSGTRSSISSNSVTSHTFMSGDIFWVLDGSDNGVSSAQISQGTREIEIASSCTSLNVR